MAIWSFRRPSWQPSWILKIAKGNLNLPASLCLWNIFCPDSSEKTRISWFTMRMWNEIVYFFSNIDVECNRLIADSKHIFWALFRCVIINSYFSYWFLGHSMFDSTKLLVLLYLFFVWGWSWFRLSFFFCDCFISKELYCMTWNI